MTFGAHCDYNIVILTYGIRLTEKHFSDYSYCEIKKHPKIRGVSREHQPRADVLTSVLDIDDQILPKQLSKSSTSNHFSLFMTRNKSEVVQRRCELIVANSVSR